MDEEDEEESFSKCDYESFLINEGVVHKNPYVFEHI